MNIETFVYICAFVSSLHILINYLFLLLLLLSFNTQICYDSWYNYVMEKGFVLIFLIQLYTTRIYTEVFYQLFHISAIY